VESARAYTDDELKCVKKLEDLGISRMDKFSQLRTYKSEIQIRSTKIISATVTKKKISS